jgi:hypothetical protein
VRQLLVGNVNAAAAHCFRLASFSLKALYIENWAFSNAWIGHASVRLQMIHDDDVDIDYDRSGSASPSQVSSSSIDHHRLELLVHRSSITSSS